METGDVRSGDTDDDVIRSTLESLIVTGDDEIARIVTGGDDIPELLRLMIKSPENGEVEEVGSGSTRQADGFSRSMLCCLTRCCRTAMMSTATNEQRRQTFLSTSADDVWPMCSFWKWAFMAMWRWNLEKKRKWTTTLVSDSKINFRNWSTKIDLSILLSGYTVHFQQCKDFGVFGNNKNNL